MKILILFLLLLSSVVESAIDDTNYSPEMKGIPCDDFKQLIQCVKNSKGFDEFEKKCICPSCGLYSSQVGGKIGGACDKEYDMSTKACVDLLSWVSKSIAVS